MFTTHFDAALSIRGGQHVISNILQGDGHNLSDTLVIVNQQYFPILGLIHNPIL